MQDFLFYSEFKTQSNIKYFYFSCPSSTKGIVSYFIEISSQYDKKPSTL